MPLDSGIGEEISPVLATDQLNTGRIKWNDSIENIRLLLNIVESNLTNLTPEDIPGLIVGGSINPSYVADLVVTVDAEGIEFSSPNFGATNVAGALEELFGGATAASITVVDSEGHFTGTNVEEVLAEIQDTVDSIVSSGGTGDVIGPASSTSNNIALFDGISGKFIKDSGVAVSSFASASHNHSASEVTSGTLAVARGGTGLASYTTGNYVRASGSTSLEQRTPAQVRSDIGAIPTTGGTFSGNVVFNSGAIYNNSLSVANNVPFYFYDTLDTPISALFMTPSNAMAVGNVAVPLNLRSLSDVTANINGTTRTILHSGSSLGSLSDVNLSGVANGNVLSYNGTSWVPVVPSGGGGGGDYLPLTGGTLTGSLSLSDKVFISAGTQALPSISVTGDTNSGIYAPAADQIGISTGGAARVNISNNGLRLNVSGSASTPSISSTSDTDTGLYFSDVNTLTITTGGSSRVHFSDAGLRLQSGGSAATPGLSLQSDQNTGIYFSGADEIAFSTGGSARAVVSNSGMTVGGNSVLTVASNLSSLANVSASSPSTSDVLTWTGSTWEPQPAPSGGGGGGTVDNPLAANLNAAGYQITNARVVGNQDISYNLASDSLGMVASGVATLSAAYNAYHYTNLTTPLTIKLPPVASALPYGFISIKLDADVSVVIDDDPGLVWSKVNISDANPTIPSTDGSAFTLFYRFDPAISRYVGNLTVMQSQQAFSTTATITSADDDGWIEPANTLFSSGGVVCNLGWHDANNAQRHSWYWISSLNVPKNATINSAKFELRAYSNKTGPFSHRVYCNAADNAGRPTAYADVNGASLTTSYDTIALPSVAGTTYYEFDFTSALQEVVNRVGWVSGNGVVVQVRDFTTSAAGRFWQPVAGSSDPIDFVVDYEA